jgi:rfaE bifunctional protein nucleotidyltransferase chain/domain
MALYLEAKTSEKEIVRNNWNIALEKHTRKEYRNAVCIKPWGYEFLAYESNRLGIWFLKLVKGGATSLHTHFHKDSFIIVISGCAKITLIDNEVIDLSCMKCVFIPKYKFHSLASFSEDTYLMEIEIFDSVTEFTDKNDLLRIDDPYKRKKTGYEASVNLQFDRLDEFGYFYLTKGFEQCVRGVKIKVGPPNEICQSDNLNILLAGEVYSNGMCLKEGSLLTCDARYQSVDENTLVLSISKFDSSEFSKIIYSAEHLALKAHQFKDSGKKVILTSGCFDILHVGHLENLKVAKSLGDILVVCLSNDEQVRKLKGNSRPVNNYDDRINLFKTISYVDYIVLYSEANIETEETLDQMMKIVDPAIWVKGDEYTETKIREKHPSLKNIVLIPTIINKSTTNIIKKINLNNESK